MIGKTFRFVVDNRTGVALASGGVVVKYRRWKFDSSGVLTYEASEQSATIGASLASNTTATGSTITNDASGEFYLGMDLRFEYTGLASSGSGSVFVYLQVSTDGGTTWADTTSGAVQGRLLNAQSWSSASGAKKGERNLS